MSFLFKLNEILRAEPVGLWLSDFASICTGHACQQAESHHESFAQHRQIYHKSHRLIDISAPAAQRDGTELKSQITLTSQGLTPAFDLQLAGLELRETGRTCLGMVKLVSQPRSISTTPARAVLPEPRKPARFTTPRRDPNTSVVERRRSLIVHAAAAQAPQQARGSSRQCGVVSVAQKRGVAITCSCACMRLIAG